MDLTLNQALNKGIEAHKAGQIKEAERLYCAILKAHPTHPHANHNLGVIAVSTNKAESALTLFKTALEANPSINQFWLSYIDALIKLGRFAEAQTVFVRAKTKGVKGSTFDLLGQRLAEQELQDPPIDQLQPIINLFTQGQLQQALSESSQMLERFTSSATLHNIVGASNAGLMQFDAAIDSYKQALQIKPDYAEAHNNMGVALDNKGNPEAAIVSYKNALKINPTFTDAYNNMGAALNNKGDPDAAIKSYKQSLKINPSYGVTYNNMGLSFEGKGDLEAAKSCYKKAVLMKPGYAEAYRNLSALTFYKDHKEDFFKMQRLYLDSNITNEQRGHLSFALSKACEDLNEFDQSFAYLKTGNEIRKKQVPYNIKHDVELFNKIKKSHPSIANITLQSACKEGDLNPIFILGMPRSGTSLVEQIVSSHSKVKGAGELDYVQRFGQYTATGAIQASIEVIADFRLRYIEALKKRSGASSFVTDKMPQNFRYVGLIFSAFPNAKIIHLERDPAATCWSNYKHYFVAEGLGYTNDLNNVVSYFGLYKDLMQFWQGNYGDRIYNLNYDNLTTNQDEETRKLIQHLGLEWEDACLSPHKNKRIVQTSSSKQVREKIYQNSSQQWRNFEPYLNGVFDKLEQSLK